MDLTNATTDMLKAIHNGALSRARRDTDLALSARTQIIAREPAFAGPSASRLASASESLRTTKTFAGAPTE